jgi:hypothetical protein
MGRRTMAALLGETPALIRTADDPIPPVRVLVADVAAWPRVRRLARLDGRPLLHVPLSCLNPRQVRDWVGDAVTGDPVLPDALDGPLYAMSGGHPALVDAVLQHLAAAPDTAWPADRVRAALAAAARDAAPRFAAWRAMLDADPVLSDVVSRLLEQPRGLTPAALEVPKPVLDRLCLVGPVARRLIGQRATIALACGAYREWVAGGGATADGG